MNYRIDYDGSNAIFTVTTAGKFNFPDFRDLVGELLSRPQWRPGIGCLFDYRHSDFLDMSLNEIEEPVALHAYRKDEVGGGRSALVMKDLGNFGMGRMYQMLAEDRVDTKFLITTEIEQGLLWLKGQDAE